MRDPPAPLKRILSPPIIGSVGGLLLGVSPLARLFLGKQAPLGILTNGLETMGKAYSPVALLVLAGSLAMPIEGAKVEEEGGTLSMPAQVLTIALVRFFLCPVLFLSLIVTAMSRWVGAHGSLFLLGGVFNGLTSSFLWLVR
jgi:auxin efflux carrier family protein